MGDDVSQYPEFRLRRMTVDHVDWHTSRGYITEFWGTLPKEHYDRQYSYLLFRLSNEATFPSHYCASLMTSLTALSRRSLSEMPLARFILRLRHEGKDITPGWIAFNLCFNPDET